MNPTIEKLIVEKDRSEHISKHQVAVEEAKEIVYGNHVFIKGKQGRWLLTGKTKTGRFLTVIIGERSQKNIYGLVTARPADKKERNFYQEYVFQLGGETNGKN